MEAENKDFFEMQDNDNELNSFDVNTKIAMVQSDKPSKLSIIVAIIVICLLLVLIIVSIATVYKVYNPSPTDCTTTTTTATASPTSSGLASSEYSDLLKLMQSIEGKINGTELTLAQLSRILMRNNSVNATSHFVQLYSALQDVLAMIDSQSMYTMNNTDLLNLLMDSTLQRLISIIGTLSNLKDTSVSTSTVTDDILLAVNQLLEIQNASLLSNSLRLLTCADILQAQPSSPSGYYHLNSRTVYCNMDELCGVGGGWTRLAYFDMSDATESCPSGFRYYQSGGVRACGRPGNSPSCVGQQFSIPNGYNYTQVCGRVTGYQYATTDAFRGGGGINSYYVEGVSITFGSPRTHIWTLAAGSRQSHTDGGLYNCPCSTGSSQTVPAFVGSNYFCESGNPNPGVGGVLYTADPLWDGQGCGSLEQACCAVPGLPWFYRDFGSTSLSDYLELRVCGDQGRNNEDSPISYYEIYVR